MKAANIGNSHLLLLKLRNCINNKQIAANAFRGNETSKKYPRGDSRGDSRVV